MLRNLVFKNLLYSLSEKAIKGITEVLAFIIVLKIHCRSSSKYLVIKEVVKDSEEELKVGSRVRSGVEGFSNLFILLSIKKKTLDIALKRIEEVMKAWFLQRRP